MRVAVDRERCMGNAVCVGTAPSVFDIDDEGYAFALDRRVDDASEAAVVQAARLCPTNAIEIDED